MITVGIIEDNEKYRRALELLLSNNKELKIVFSIVHCNDLAGMVSFCPDVVIMDIDLPGRSGIDGVRLMKERCPDVNIFMLTMFEDEEFIFESIKAGAIGYLLKKDPPKRILEAVEKIHNGEPIISGKIARRMLQYFSTPGTSTQLAEYDLSRRESEVLQLLMKGHTYKEISEQCFISMDTVFSHIKNIYKKLNVRSKAEIILRFHK
jgi:DNA-binding NarL/FixJ family response regulator